MRTPQRLLILNLDTEFEVISLRRPLSMKARMKTLSYFDPAGIPTHLLPVTAISSWPRAVSRSRPLGYMPLFFLVKLTKGFNDFHHKPLYHIPYYSLIYKSILLTYFKRRRIFIFGFLNHLFRVATLNCTQKLFMIDELLLRNNFYSWAEYRYKLQRL